VECLDEGSRGISGRSGYGSAVKALLERSKSLQICPITFEVIRHPRRDAGVLRECVDLLKPYQQEYRYALVMFDREGCGKEELSARELEYKVEQQLNVSGWQGRAAAVVLDPELEVWVLAQSSHA